MPSTTSETFYDLAIRAIEEQEREVNGLRTRTGTLVAAAAVAGTVLAREVFAGSHPDGELAWAATAVGLGGLVMVLAASVYLLSTHSMSFSIDAPAAFEKARDFGALDADDHAGVHIDLTYTLAAMQSGNGLTVNRLRTAFAIALGGLVAETVGLGLGAALA
jgi:hypothetical protein